MRQLSNRSLNTTADFKSHSDFAADFDCNDFYETASACDYDYGDDDDDQTCSTCSSTLTTTSTDSESDLDDFGFDPYYNMMPAAPLPSSRSRPQPSTQWSTSRPDDRTFDRKCAGGGPSALKISYVDSLPLARTNPAQKPSDPYKSQVDNKKKAKSKSKTLHKFKKDNCVVS